MDINKNQKLSEAKINRVNIFTDYQLLAKLQVKELVILAKLKDITGNNYGRLIVKQFAGRHDSRSYWLCTCVCGNETTVEGSKLKSGHTQSCGCLMQERLKSSITTHNMRHTPTYTTWQSMMARCYNPKTENYPRYGDRGITVADSWHTFTEFYKDMGEKPPGMTLERLNNNLGYSKDNCVWASVKQQANNKRNNVFLEFNGIRKTVAQWNSDLGFPKGLIEQRMRVLGWSVDKALTTPVRKTRGQ